VKLCIKPIVTSHNCDFIFHNVKNISKLQLQCNVNATLFLIISTVSCDCDFIPNFDLIYHNLSLSHNYHFFIGRNRFSYINSDLKKGENNILHLKYTVSF